MFQIMDESDEAIVGRINSDLANDLENLAQRVLSFVYKNVGAKVPHPGDFTDADREILAAAHQVGENFRQAMDDQALHMYCEHIWAVVRQANRYVDEQAPWSLRKSDKPDDHVRMHTILYTLMEVIRHMAVYIAPLMPESSSKILAQLGIEGEVTFDILKKPLESGTLLNELHPIFQSIDV